MGLPMYRDTDEVDAHNAAAKLDRVAAARRSAIRREATVRPTRSPRTHTPNSMSSREDYRERLLRRERLARDRDQRQIEHLEAELERLRRNGMRSRARLELDNEGLNIGPRFRVDGTVEIGIREATDVSPQDVIRQLPRPSRDSNSLHFVEMSSPGMFSSQRSTSPRRYRTSGRPYMPSPPYLDGDLPNDGVPERRYVPVVDGPVELTPNFAPARGFYRRPEPQISDARLRAAIIERYEEASAMETPPPEDWEASYPPLRRVGHLSPRPRPTSHHSNFDGLGDRRRSVSPNSADSREEETWTTLMTTMNDDDHPSVQTSFASTTASDSVARSNRSSQTAATSFGEIGLLDDSCDLDLPFGITAEDARELRARHDHTERLAVSDSPNDTPEDVVQNLETMERRAAEISMLQNILTRMQRRQDVPAEWWAAVGLSPVVWDSLASARNAAATASTEQRDESRANA